MLVVGTLMIEPTEGESKTAEVWSTSSAADVSILQTLSCRKNKQHLNLLDDGEEVFEDDDDDDDDVETGGDIKCKLWDDYEEDNDVEIGEDIKCKLCYAEAADIKSAVDICKRRGGPKQLLLALVQTVYAPISDLKFSFDVRTSEFWISELSDLDAENP
ncbi:hypothetical protein QVD17_08794 [Tagetes erecta]|uniref:Uncharacterized protein n=1 Tax=Tagetes erecta TaxID=13708 RepID=A0AAD8L2R7_TARER|nr:hypothetical protein QVD17_08794 [Tagetes erecta]